VNLAYTLRTAGRAAVEVYDVSGRLVKRLADGKMPAGQHRVSWDCRDSDGRPAANGTYFFRLSAGGEWAVSRVALIR
jgi:flagellar hook assembly protein FlgD